MKFTNSKIPKKIEPCPIQESIFEVRYETDLPEEVIPGILYNKLSTLFDKGIERLPILEVPASIRKNEPNLKYAAHHIFKSEKFRFQIGPSAFSFVCLNDYVGWNEYKNNIQFVLQAIEDVNLIKFTTRTGLRYVNYFKNVNIFEYLKLDYNVADNSLINEKNTLSSEFGYKDYVCLLKISNQHLTENKEQLSIIDIDIIKKFDNESNLDYVDIAETSHDIEKEIFFNLLKENYLSSNYAVEY